MKVYRIEHASKKLTPIIAAASNPYDIVDKLWENTPELAAQLSKDDISIKPLDVFELSFFKEIEKDLSFDIGSVSFSINRASCPVAIKSIETAKLRIPGYYRFKMRKCFGIIPTHLKTLLLSSLKYFNRDSFNGQETLTDIQYSSNTKTLEFILKRIANHDEVEFYNYNLEFKPHREYIFENELPDNILTYKINSKISDPWYVLTQNKNCPNHDLQGVIYVVVDNILKAKQKICAAFNNKNCGERTLPPNYFD